MLASQNSFYHKVPFMSRGNKIPPEWKRWIAENRMLHVKDERILAVLIRNGFGEEVAKRQISSVSKTTSYQAGTWVAHRYRKLESLLEVYRQLSILSEEPIERRSNIGRDEFLAKYYAPNRPVIITGMMTKWKALSLWTPEYLKKQCGDMIVEITAGRQSDPQYELNLEKHKIKLRFRDYIDMVLSGGETNDYYLVANNFFFKEAGAKLLYEDIEQFPEYLNDIKGTENGSLWFGPAGTVTPLHHDLMNILVAQVYGRKRFTLIPSNHVHLLYNEKGVFSEIDLEQPDLIQHPMFQDVKLQEVVLEPGEVLFVPVGWWHHVRALDIAITVSFINFLFPNTYSWNNPQIYR